MEPRKDIQAPVRIEITPTVEEYRQLCRDLGELRRQGAETNTAAILAAVRAAAGGGKMHLGSTNGKGARTRPNPRKRKVRS
jgi:hypothetical protein